MDEIKSASGNITISCEGLSPAEQVAEIVDLLAGVIADNTEPEKVSDMAEAVNRELVERLFCKAHKVNATVFERYMTPQ